MIWRKFTILDHYSWWCRCLMQRISWTQLKAPGLGLSRIGPRRCVFFLIFCHADEELVTWKAQNLDTLFLKPSWFAAEKGWCFCSKLCIPRIAVSIDEIHQQWQGIKATAGSSLPPQEAVRNWYSNHIGVKMNIAIEDSSKWKYIFKKVNFWLLLRVCMISWPVHDQKMKDSDFDKEKALSLRLGVAMGYREKQLRHRKRIGNSSSLPSISDFNIFPDFKLFELMIKIFLCQKKEG